MTDSVQVAEDRALAGALSALLGKWLPAGHRDDDRADPLWRNLTDGGWLDLLADGLSPGGDVSTDAALAAAAEFGAHLARPATVLTCGFLVPLLNALGPDNTAAAALRARLDTEGVLAVPVPVVTPEARGYAFADHARAVESRGGYRLNGTVTRLLELDRSPRALIPIEFPDGVKGLAAVTVERVRAQRTTQDTVIPGVTADTLVLQGTEVPAQDVLAGGVRGVSAAVTRAGLCWSLALDAHAVGIGAAVLRRTVAHASARSQFGQPIGAFQAVQHLIADMHVALETSRSLMTLAGRELTACRDASPEIPAVLADILASRLHSAEMARSVCESGIQVHGGAGFTWELGLHHWYRAALFAQYYCTDVRGIRTLLGAHLQRRAQAGAPGAAHVPETVA
jgi:alkylation response protein AidB-like acyl-CoA dehydrogenase